MTFSPVHLIVPKSVLSQGFIDQLALDTSLVVTLLKENDSYRLPGQVGSTWVPTVPMRMIHHRDDELVPFQNAQVAFNAFITAGATSVELVEETFAIGVTSDPAKTVHVGSAFPELLDGWEWLDNFKQ